MTYRTGIDGVTILREEPYAELVAVVTNGDRDLAERICALLNGDGPAVESREWSVEAYRIYSRWVKAEDTSRRVVYAAIQEAYAAGLASVAPSGPPGSTQAAQNDPGTPASTPDRSEAAEIKCDCGHDGLDEMFHLTPCPIAVRRNERCRDRVTGLHLDPCTCPRHGAVI